MKKDLNIATIIACRLKSSRLPGKALLKIGDLTSVEYCIKNTLKFTDSKMTVLATTTEKEDAELANYTYSPEVKFYQGPVEDVMQRYVDVIDLYGIDIFIRVTADMPFVSDDILKVILKSHLENQADYSIGTQAAIGTNLEVINAEALRKAKSYFPTAEYSEYMSFYFTSNPGHFKLNKVELPPELVRNYRLTLDYEEDLKMFNKIQSYLEQNKIEPTLKNIFKFLDENPSIAQMNQNLIVKYTSDPTLVETLNRVTKIINK